LKSLELQQQQCFLLPSLMCVCVCVCVWYDWGKLIRGLKFMIKSLLMNHKLLTCLWNETWSHFYFKKIISCGCVHAKWKIVNEYLRRKSFIKKFKFFSYALQNHLMLW
jgi:hypothetical protein